MFITHRKQHIIWETGLEADFQNVGWRIHVGPNKLEIAIHSLLRERKVRDNT